METLEKSRMCRLCGKQSGIAVDIFDENECHFRKINAILPILVHEMDLLPKQMCHRCSYKLEEFYNFYEECGKTDSELKKQLSWMRKEDLDEKIVTPMVKMIPFKIKTEPQDDSVDPKLNGHVNDKSILFPASFLQNNFDSCPSPIITCSRCRCLCNTDIQINKNSSQRKDSKLDTENQAHCSNFISSNSKKVNELSEAVNTVDKHLNSKKDFEKDENVKEIKIKEIPIVNLVSDTAKSGKNNCINLSRSDQLNRELRPRKGSVDYNCHKKKGLTPNLKIKFKNKLDLFDPLLVNSLNVKVPESLSQSQSLQSTPFIKLEKVDDHLRTLRTRKNLEEFNKRIKEFQRNRRSIHQEENLRKKISKEGIRKSFQKEHQNRNIQNLGKLHQKSFQIEENSHRKKLIREECPNEDYLQKEENSNRKSSHPEENSVRKHSHKEEMLNRSLQIEENHIESNIQTSEIQNRKSLLLEEKEVNGHSSNFNIHCSINGESIDSTSELKIKQEDVIIENNDSLPNGIKEKTFEAVSLKDQATTKPTNRLPLCAVKLEKDYTCNVDYPRLKIKRHLAVTVAKPDNGASNDMIHSKNIPQSGKRRKKCNKNDIGKNDNGNVSTKKSKIKFKKLKVIKDKLAHGSKKKGKKLDIHKQMEPDKNVDVLQTELKHYCEECNTSFRNRELLSIHPCWQK